MLKRALVITALAPVSALPESFARVFVQLPDSLVETLRYSLQPEPYSPAPASAADSIGPSVPSTVRNSHTDSARAASTNAPLTSGRPVLSTGVQVQVMFRRRSTLITAPVRQWPGYSYARNGWRMTRALEAWHTTRQLRSHGVYHPPSTLHTWRVAQVAVSRAETLTRLVYPHSV
jgi:hypothetical protein